MNIKVYQIDDCDFVVSKFSKEETKAWYEKEFSTEINLNEMRECNLDHDKMSCELINGEWEEITFKEAIKRTSEYRSFTSPFIIASTEY